MTTVTLRDETARRPELSSEELDQVTGGRPAGGGGHGGNDVLPAVIIAAAAVPIVGALVVGLWRNIFGGIE
jgi:hypothetical protein